MSGLEPTRVRGLLVSPALAWIRKTWGDPFLATVLARLPEETRGQFDRLLLPLAEIPVAEWQDFLDACHAELRATGSGRPEAFDRAMIREGGPGVVQTFFKSVLGTLGPAAVIGRMGFVHARGFSPSVVEVVENVQGRARIRYRHHASAHAHVKRYVPLLVSELLAHAGAKDVRAMIAKDALADGSSVVELDLAYQ